MELAEGFIRPANRQRRDVQDYGMTYPQSTVRVKAAQHSYSAAASFRRKAFQHFRQFVKKQPEDSIYKHGRFKTLEDWWHSLPDVPNATTNVTGTKEYWLTGPMTCKNLQFWQECDAALKMGPTPAPLPKAAREVLLQGRKVVVYDNVKGGSKGAKPAPHKYNPYSAAAVEAEGSDKAITLGAAGVFKNKKNENHMNAKGQIQRGDDSATHKMEREGYC